MTPSAPAIPDKITDQGLLLAAFILLLSFLAVGLALKYGPALIVAWRSAGNGHSAKADAVVAGLARLETAVAVLTKQVERLCEDYHERLVPSQHLSALAQLRMAGMLNTANEEERRVAALVAEEEKRQP